MPQLNDLSRSLVCFEPDATLVAFIELSQSSWLIAGTIPGVERQPLKKIAPDETTLLGVRHRWRDDQASAILAGQTSRSHPARATERTVHAHDLGKVLTEAARICAEGLDVPFCKVCRYRSEENDLLVEAGVGWHRGVVGHVVSQANESSPQGRAFMSACDADGAWRPTTKRCAEPRSATEKPVQTGTSGWFGMCDVQSTGDIQHRSQKYE
jgi:hypothetical protein